MTTDTTATANAACVACRRDTSDDYGRVRRRALLANDGATRYMCGGCYGAARIENLRGYRWLPRPSSQPPAPRTARPHGGRRVDIDVTNGGCALCGIAVDGEWPPVHFELAGLHILGRRCAPCDGGVNAADYDALQYLRGVHGREQLTPDDFYAGVALQHDRLGVRRPPPADAPWQF